VQPAVQVSSTEDVCSSTNSSATSCAGDAVKHTRASR
jgi:hypothetical protein